MRYLADYINMSEIDMSQRRVALLPNNYCSLVLYLTQNPTISPLCVASHRSSILSRDKVFDHGKKSSCLHLSHDRSRHGHLPPLQLLLPPGRPRIRQEDGDEVRRAGEEAGVPAGVDQHGGDGIRAVRAVHRLPVLRVVEREQLRGHSVLLPHRLQHPRQALRRLRFLPSHLRLWRHQLHQPAAAMTSPLAATNSVLFHDQYIYICA